LISTNHHPKKLLCDDNLFPDIDDSVADPTNSLLKSENSSTDTDEGQLRKLNSEVLVDNVLSLQMNFVCLFVA